MEETLRLGQLNLLANQNDPKSSFNDIKNLEIRVWRKILENNRLWDEGIMLYDFGTL